MNVSCGARNSNTQLMGEKQGFNGMEREASLWENSYLHHSISKDDVSKSLQGKSLHQYQIPYLQASSRTLVCYLYQCVHLWCLTVQIIKNRYLFILNQTIFEGSTILLGHITIIKYEIIYSFNKYLIGMYASVFYCCVTNYSKT